MCALDVRLALAGVPAIVEPLDVSRPLLAASQLRSQGLSQQLAQSQLAEREQSLARQEQIRGLYALDQPQAAPAATTPGPLVENGETVPPRVGEGLSPALTQQPQVPTWRRAMAIDPPTGLKLRQGMAEAESSEGKARDERMAFLGQVAESILKQDTQAAYEQGLAVIRREFPDMHVPMSAVYNKADVQQVADMGVSARLRLGQQHAGLTPIYGTDAQGKPVMGRMTQTGFEQIQLPPGFTLTPGLQKYDTGTELLAVDRGGNVVSRIPKEVREAAAEQAGGTVEGKEAAERPAKMRQAQSSIASLDRQHSRVLDMLDRAEDLVDRGWTTGLMAKPMSALPSDAKALAGVIRSIQANLGITELQALKGAGVSLGQVTEAEHALLQRLYGELEQAQSAEDVRRTLSDFRRELHAAQRERQAAYDRDFGGERAPHGSTGRRSSAQAPAAGSSAKVITREQARQLADKRGVSVEQVLQDAAAAGYGIR